MTDVRNVIEVALREVVVRGRGRAWIASTILLALGLSVAVTIPTLFANDDASAPPTRQEVQIGIVGEASPTIEAAVAHVEAATGAVVTSLPSPSREAALQAVEAHDLDAAVDLTGPDPEVIGPAPSFLGEDDPLASFLADTIGRIDALVARGIPVDQAVSALEFTPVEVVAAVEGDPTGASRRLGVAYAGLIFTYTTLLVYGTWMVNGIVEEKANRIVEVLLATLRPRELVVGKVLGLGILGIAQVVAVVLPAVLVSMAIGDSLIPAGVTGAVLGIIGWWMLGFLLFGTLLAATGSLVQRAEDAQSAVFPVVAVVLVGFFAAMSALDDPNGTVAVVASFVPFTSPLVMVVRTTLGAAPWWQVVLAVGSIVLGTLVTGAVAGRVYAGAILRTHGKVKLREAWRTEAG